MFQGYETDITFMLSILFAGCDVHFLEQQLARSEFDAGSGTDHAGLPVAGIAAGAFGLTPGVERAEALKGNIVTVRQFFAQDGNVHIYILQALFFRDMQTSRQLFY